MLVPNPHSQRDLFKHPIHLEYKIGERKGNKNGSEMGRVLNIKATLRIQIRKIQLCFCLNKSLLTVDRFHPNWRQTLKRCEELEAGRLLGKPSRTSDEPPELRVKGPIMYTNFCIDASLQWNNRFVLVAEQSKQISAIHHGCGEMQTRSRPAVHSTAPTACAHPRSSR